MPYLGCDREPCVPRGDCRLRLVASRAPSPLPPCSLLPTTRNSRNCPLLYSRVALSSTLKYYTLPVGDYRLAYSLAQSPNYSSTS